MRRHILLCVALLVGLQILAAQNLNKPNLTGTWIFNPQASTVEGSAPSASTFYIKHDEPHFHLSRTHVFNGKSDTWSIDLVTDGKHEVVEHNSYYTARTRMYWEGSSLVLDMKMVTKKGERATNLVKYSLSEDGKTFIALERYKDSTEQHLNKWVLLLDQGADATIRSPEGRALNEIALEKGHRAPGHRRHSRIVCG